MTPDKTGPAIPDMSVEVDDVDAAYAAVRDSGAEIVPPCGTKSGAYGGSSSAAPTAGWSTYWATADSTPLARPGRRLLPLTAFIASRDRSAFSSVKERR